MTASGDTSSPPPHDASGCAARQLAQVCLAGAVLATCAGVLAVTFRGDGTSINAWLFLSAGLAHGEARLVERAAATLLLLLAIGAALRPRASLLLPIAVYLLLEAVAGWNQRGYPFSEWAPPAHAARFGLPLALLLVSAAARSGRSPGFAAPAAGWILRLALASVFVIHGLEALRLHPWFVDLILSSGVNLAGLRLHESTAGHALHMIGVVDLVVALLLLIRPVPAILVWAAFWGAVTAWARVTAGGWGAYPDVLLRSGHVLGPVALLLLRYPDFRYWKRGRFLCFRRVGSS
jgi:hypothetical protein